MRLHLLAASVALILALAGCASRGGLQPSTHTLDPATLDSERSLAATGTTWPTQDWWTGLGDRQLDALIAEALADNPGLAVADARARQAQAAVGVAQAARGPELDAGASISGARIPTTVLPAEAGGGHFAWARYGYLSFDWGLDLWGGRRAAWQAAVGAARAAEVERRAARIQLSANVARAYVRLGYAFTRQDLARDELARARQARTLTAQRVHAGIDSQLQLKQGDAEVAAGEEQLALAGRAVDAARSALAVLLGKGPDRGLHIARPRTLAPADVVVPEQLPAGLIAHRADLVAARWRVEAATRDVEAARTRFLPNVSLGALAGLISLGGTSVLQAPARFYQVGPSLSLPIFDGGRLRASLAGKDAQYDLAAAQYNQTLVQAVNQVADDLAAQRALVGQRTAQQRAVQAAREAWQLARLRYRAGVGSSLEALTVRQQLLAAEQRAAALEAQQVDLSVQLIEALGGGYRPRSEASPDAPAPAAGRAVSPSHPTRS